MVTIVIVINVLLALICLFAAWQIWNLRRTLAGVADTLAAAAHSSHGVLHGAPKAIISGQLGIYQLRQAYRQSGPQLQRVRQALALLGLGRSLWIRFPYGNVGRSRGRVARPLPFAQRGVRVGSRAGKKRL